jgi:lipopolysaccharide biosynthesis protein
VLTVQPPGSVRLEGADRSAELSGVDRVAVVAHWDPVGRVTRSTHALLGALEMAGFEIVLVSAEEGDGPLGWGQQAPVGLTVLRRPNLGYDFGSWATALDRFPGIKSARLVLLMNDSLAGPFAPIQPLLDHFDRSQADVWAMTDTTQLGHHLQSYCLGFKGGCLESPALAAFWRSIRVEESREAVIDQYELGLGRLLERERFATDVAIPGWRVVEGDDNPTTIGWRRLLDEGFPFVKRQVITEPGVCPDGSSAPAELLRRFGVEVMDWL